MINPQSTHDYLKPLANFAASPIPESGETVGATATKKVIEVFKVLKKDENLYQIDKKRLEGMRRDTGSLKEKILGLVRVEGSWNNAEIQNGLQQTLLQGFDSIANILNYKMQLLGDLTECYHENLLSKAMKAQTEAGKIGEKVLTPQEFIRTYVDTALQTAFLKKSIPHHLLRDPSSLPSEDANYEFLTLSFIDKEGQVHHDLLVYSDEKKIWINQKSQKYSADLGALITTIVGKDSLGVAG